jgi:CheY-like chemotaxis protein
VLCYSGQRGLDEIGRGEFALAVLDIGLPDMSGLAVLEQMRLRAPDVLRPQMHFCGHHHIPQSFTVGPSSIRALEIIRTSTTPPYKATPSWCHLLLWKDGTLSDATG